MQYFSRSQGKIIDTDLESGGTGLQRPSPESEYDILGELAKQRLGSTTATRILEQREKLYPQPSATERKAEKDLGDSIKAGFWKGDEITSILNKYSGQDISGTGPWIKAMVFKGESKKGTFGGLAPAQGTNVLQTAMSDYNRRLFEIAGKTFPGKEQQILEGLLLDIRDDEERLRDKLEQGQKMLLLEAQNRGVTIPEEYKKKGTITSRLGQTQMPSQPEQTRPQKGALEKFLTGETIPIASSILGGVIGTAGAGPVGGVAGGGLGMYGGTQLKNVLASLAGYKEFNAGESVESGMNKATIDMALRTLFGHKKIFGQLRDVVSGSNAVPIDTTPIIQAGDKYASNNPLVKETWKKIKGSIGDEISEANLLDKLKVWGSGFKVTGGAKDTGLGQLYANLYSQGRPLLSQTTSILTSLLRESYQVPQKAMEAGKIAKIAATLKYLLKI